MARSVTKLYLILYNASMLCGWLLVGSRIASAVLSGRGLRTSFEASRNLVMGLLTASCLETVHAAVGLVRSPVVTTAIQAFIRLFAFGAGLNTGCPTVSSGIAANATIVAWTASETIRYSYYLSALMSERPSYALTWLRYTAFIVLYPIGVLGEVGSLLGSIPYLERTGALSVKLPNSLNFGFWMPYFIRAMVYGAYPYGFYVMYTYMLSQRRKTL